MDRTKSIRRRTFKNFGFLTLNIAALTSLVSSVALAQSPQNTLLPSGIAETGLTGALQGVPSGLSFLFANPYSKPSAASLGPQVPVTYGVTEDFNVLAPGEAPTKGLALTGAALYAIPVSGKSGQSQNQAIDQTVAYSRGPLNLSFGYLNVGKFFAIDNSSTSAAPPSISSKLLGEKGQDGFNSSLNYSQNGSKFGLQLSSITDSLQNQHRLSETMSMERDLDKALSLGFQTTETTSEQLATGLAKHSTSDVLHLAYSPTLSGFLLDAKNTSTFDDQGNQSNDLLLKVSQHFAAVNLSSQFETSTSNSSGTTNSWLSQKFNASDTLRPGLTFSGSLAKKEIALGTDTDDYDVIIKSAENRYLTLAAEYSKHDADDGTGSGKQSLVASITPGSAGPLGPLLLNLSINNQQSQLLDGFQSYTASLSGQIASSNTSDFGLAGAKYVLAYSDASAGGEFGVNGHAKAHSSRTLRLVRAPSGKNGLSWTVSQQQRLDQNGQPQRTASDYEAKYALSSRLTVAVNSVFEMAKSDGSFTDQDQEGININWNQAKSCSMIAQYVHSRCPSQNIANEDGYFLTYAGPLLSSPNMNVGLGVQTKQDFSGQPAFGTTANVAYGWKADDENQLNISSKVTDWQNRGFNADYDNSVEAAGQINFQRQF